MPLLPRPSDPCSTRSAQLRSNPDRFERTHFEAELLVFQKGTACPARYCSLASSLSFFLQFFAFTTMLNFKTWRSSVLSNVWNISVYLFRVICPRHGRSVYPDGHRDLKG